MDRTDIRWVVSDLDDTLLDPKKQISDRAVDTIARLRARGVFFTFVTGRPPYAAKRFAERVGVTGPMVCCNGAVLLDGDCALSEATFSLAPLSDLLEDVADTGATVLVYTDGVEYALRETPWTAQRARDGRPFPPLPTGPSRPKTAVKINFMGGDAAPDYPSLLPRIRALALEYAVSLYGETGCEIVAAGVNKAKGLRALCQLHGIAPRQVLAIGDNENDVELLQTVGIGAAVANASPGAAAAADYRCRAAYTDGVIEAIERFVFGEVGEA